MIDRAGVHSVREITFGVSSLHSVDIEEMWHAG